MQISKGIVFCSCLLVFLSVSSANAFQASLVLQTGDALDSNFSGTTFYRPLRPPSISDSGLVVFSGFLETGNEITQGNSAGIWHSDGVTHGLIVQESMTVPGKDNVFSTFSFEPDVSRQGSVAFKAGLNQYVGEQFFESGIWFWHSNELYTVALDGGNAPGGTSTRFRNIFSPYVNDSGVVVFDSDRSSPFDSATMYYEIGNSLSLVPLSVPEGLSISGTGNPQINEQSQLGVVVVFRNNQGGVNFNNDMAIVTRKSSLPATIAYREGQSMPELSAGERLGNILEGNIAFNDHGHLAFLSSVQNAPSTNVANTALWAEIGGVAKLVARSGGSAPGGYIFDEIHSFSFSNSDDAAFRAELLNGVGGISSSSNAGIWAYLDGELVEVAREGQVFGTGTDASVFLDFEAPVVNSLGQVAFQARLQGLSWDSLWLFDPTEGLMLVARESEFGWVDGRTVGKFSFNPSNGNGPYPGIGLNDAGQLVFSADLNPFLEEAIFVVEGFSAPTIAGDFDDDDDVDGSDFLWWQRNSGIADDLLDWQAAYGLSASLSSTQTVPEPAGSFLMLLALAIASNRNFQRWS